MKHFLFITIDTEEDIWGGYTVKNPSVENIKNIPMLQEIFNKYSAIPTYLINYPVATNKYSIEILKDMHDNKHCDIGTHCHPWNTPPFDIEMQSAVNSFMCNLSEELVFEKIAKLHNTIAENFNYTPIVFRAGRWGVGKNVINAIQHLGYKIDTSVTPFQDWSDWLGPTFNLRTNTAHGLSGMDKICLKAENCVECDKSNHCIIEIPPTIGFLQKNFISCINNRNILMNSAYSKFHILGILDRLKLLNHRVLSPEVSTINEMIKLSSIMLDKGHRFLNMSFHSTSLLPGKSPFVKNNKDLKTFLNKIDKYLEYLTKKGISCIGMSQALEVLF